VLTGWAGIADAVATGAIMACRGSQRATDPPKKLTAEAVLVLSTTGLVPVVGTEVALR
jgi:hypothetical protein